jgi:hypothetical protein
MKGTPLLRDFDFCPALADMLQTRRTTGRNGKVLDGLDALSTTNNLLILRSLMFDLKSKRTLEIGLSVGGSALVFGATHRDLGRAYVRQHVALDPFQETVWDCSGLMAVERTGLSGYLDYRRLFPLSNFPKCLSAASDLK